MLLHIIVGEVHNFQALVNRILIYDRQYFQENSILLIYSP